MTASAGPGPGPDVRASGPSGVQVLVSRLDGLDQLPLAAQVEVLDAVRRGLDEELARPVADG